MKIETTQLKSDITKLENIKKEQENKLQTEKKESNYWENKASELDTDLQVYIKSLNYYNIVVNIVRSHYIFLFNFRQKEKK